MTNSFRILTNSGQCNCINGYLDLGNPICNSSSCNLSGCLTCLAGNCQSCDLTKFRTLNTNTHLC